MVIFFPDFSSPGAQETDVGPGGGRALSDEHPAGHLGRPLVHDDDCGEAKIISRRKKSHSFLRDRGFE